MAAKKKAKEEEEEEKRKQEEARLLREEEERKVREEEELALKLKEEEERRLLEDAAALADSVEDPNVILSIPEDSVDDPMIQISSGEPNAVREAVQTADSRPKSSIFELDDEDAMSAPSDLSFLPPPTTSYETEAPASSQETMDLVARLRQTYATQGAPPAASKEPDVEEVEEVLHVPPLQVLGKNLASLLYFTKSS
jgi:hypothetical protein